MANVRVLSVKPVRDGYQVAVSNAVEPLRFTNLSFEDVVFDLEMKGYDVSRLRKNEARRARGQLTPR